MHIRLIVGLILGLVLSSASAKGSVGGSSEEEGTVQKTGTFSNADLDEKETGDISGAEIRIVLGRYGYQAVVQWFEGVPSVLMISSRVQFDRNHIAFEFLSPKPPAKQVRFEGLISNERLEGVFIVRLDKGFATPHVDLARTKSFWDPVRGYKISGTYSDLREDKETDGLQGMEIFIPGSGKYGSVMQIARGLPSDLIYIAEIEVNKDKVGFKFKDPYSYSWEGQAFFRGEVDEDGLRGEITRQSGSSPHHEMIVEKVDLKRTTSYWDRKGRRFKHDP